MFRILVITILITMPLISAESDIGQTSPELRHRVIVSTDIGGTDYDDFQSMVHYLLYSDIFDTEGIISSPIGGPGRKSDILKVIDVYEKDYGNLKSWSSSYPGPQQLRDMSKQGAIDRAGLKGFDTPTEGSQWIIKCAKRQDPRPLWVLVWGGLEDVAQALHDEPAIESKLRVYFIGGPNKKWSTTAYDYISRNHRSLWIIEANSTYRGWFTGGDQEGQWNNDSFPQQHIADCGALGEFFVKGISFKSQIRSTIKMGDTPSVVYLLGKSPEDPSSQSWGGSFVRAWDRPRYTFEHLPTVDDTVETFAIIEIIRRINCDTTPDSKSYLIIDKQRFEGFVDMSGNRHFIFSPKTAKKWNYTIESTVPELNNQKGSFTSYRPNPEQANHPSGQYENWWTDNPDPAFAEGVHQGAKTISRWRKEFLSDFAQRMQRCKKLKQ